MTRHNTETGAKSTLPVWPVVLDLNPSACYSGRMADGAAIRKAREQRGWSQSELAKMVGTTQQTIDKIESEEVKFSRYLNAIRERLGIADSLTKSLTSAEQSPPLLGERDLPVFASIESGTGAVTVSPEPVDFVRRPAPLAQVKDGYAVLVSGESMVPAFEAGDMVLVHPHLPLTRDCDVILYGQNEDGTELVTIKRLVRYTDRDWYLRQWSPPEGKKTDFSLSRKLWPKCHRIVGKFSRR